MRPYKWIKAFILGLLLARVVSQSGMPVQYIAELQYIATNKTYCLAIHLRGDLFLAPAYCLCYRDVFEIQVRMKNKVYKVQNREIEWRECLLATLAWPRKPNIKTLKVKDGPRGKVEISKMNHARILPNRKKSILEEEFFLHKIDFKKPLQLRYANDSLYFYGNCQECINYETDIGAVVTNGENFLVGIVYKASSIDDFLVLNLLEDQMFNRFHYLEECGSESLKQDEEMVPLILASPRNRKIRYIDLNSSPGFKVRVINTSFPEFPVDKVQGYRALQVNGEVIVTGHRNFILLKINKNKWIELPKMKQPRIYHAMVAIMERVYVFGGMKGNRNFGNEDVLSSCEYLSLSSTCCDPPSPRLKWKKCSKTSVEMWNIVAIENEKDIITLWSTDSSMKTYYQLDFFNPKNNSWQHNPQSYMPANHHQNTLSNSTRRPMVAVDETNTYALLLVENMDMEKVECWLFDLKKKEHLKKDYECPMAKNYENEPTFNLDEGTLLSFQGAFYFCGGFTSYSAQHIYRYELGDENWTRFYLDTEDDAICHRALIVSYPRYLIEE